MKKGTKDLLALRALKGPKVIPVHQDHPDLLGYEDHLVQQATSEPQVQLDPLDNPEAWALQVSKASRAIEESEDQRGIEDYSAEPDQRVMSVKRVPLDQKETLDRLGLQDPQVPWVQRVRKGWMVLRGIWVLRVLLG